MNIIIITIASIIICPIGSYILAKYCKKKGTSNTLIKTAAFYSVAILTFSYLEITTIYQSIETFIVAIPDEWLIIEYKNNNEEFLEMLNKLSPDVKKQTLNRIEY